jgi:hypothetical protein
MAIDPSKFLTPKKGMTSVEAAQLYLAEEKKHIATEQAIFNMEDLEKAALVRWLGFPFNMTVHSNRIIFTDMTSGLKTTCLYTQPMDMKVGKRMVRSLARLKRLHDERDA